MAPIHADVALRGYKFKGIVVSDKMRNSVVVERPFMRKIQKYERYEKRRTRVSAHNPECIKAKKGDMVMVQECRPLSKSKSFVVMEKIEVKK